MTQPRTMNPDSLQDLQVIDSDGSKVGKVDTIFLDVETNKPEWAAVKTGMFGGKTTLVPLVNASTTEDGLHVPYTKDAIKSAPHHDPDVELSNSDEAELFNHYGIPFSGETVTADTSRMDEDAPARSGSVGHDTSGPNTDDAMTRSEERLHVA
jgi:sporulation protein YlmC with PRC-barrel domain